MRIIGGAALNTISAKNRPRSMTIARRKTPDWSPAKTPVRGSAGFLSSSVGRKGWGENSAGRRDQKRSLILKKALFRRGRAFLVLHASPRSAATPKRIDSQEGEGGQSWASRSLKSLISN